MRIYRVTLTACDVPEFDGYHVPDDAVPLDVIEFALDGPVTSETIFSLLEQRVRQACSKPGRKE